METGSLRKWFVALAVLGQPLCLAPAVSAAQDMQQRDAFSVRFDLQVAGEDTRLEGLLKSASRLHEEKDKPVRSLARLEARLQGDLENFNRVLRAEGYYAAGLDHRIARDGRRVSILIVVEPGIRYRVKSVAVDLIDAEKRPDIALKPVLDALMPLGSPIRSEAVVKTEQTLVTFLANTGHPFAVEGERDVIIDHSDSSASITYHVMAGPKALFDGLHFNGLARTEASYLERFTPWKEGDLYRQEGADEFRRRLLASGLFQSVTVTPAEPMAIQSDRGEIAVPLDVALEEAKARLIELGAGYSTGAGFQAEASWTHRNLWGRGESLKLTATGGELEQSVKARFRKPHFRRFDQTLTATTRLGREHLPAYNAYLVETAVGLERRLNRKLAVGGGVDLKATRVSDSGSKDNYLLAGLPISVTWDSTDSLLDPTQGFRANLRVKPAYSVINDSFTYVVGELNGSAYKQFFGQDRLTFALRGRAGSIYGASFDQLPLSERFFAGGGGSVRGYDYQGLGEKDADGHPVGGRSVAEVALEARVKFSDTIGIVPFVEGGNVYQDRLPDFSDFRWGAGVGLRYYTSFAPIRLDVAVPLNKRPGDPNFAVYISLGQSF